MSENQKLREAAQRAADFMRGLPLSLFLQKPCTRTLKTRLKTFAGRMKICVLKQTAKFLI